MIHNRYAASLIGDMPRDIALRCQTSIDITIDITKLFGGLRSKKKRCRHEHVPRQISSNGDASLTNRLHIFLFVGT